MSREDAETEIEEWVQARCSECGRTFPQRKPYERLCPPCFKLSYDYPLLWGDKAVLWMQRALEAEEKKRQAAEAASVRASVRAQPIPQSLVRDLLFLCHPDKHQGSERSAKATRALLFMRQKKKGGRK